MSLTSARPAFGAGISEAWGGEIHDAINALTSPWTAYTPVWTTASGGEVIGTGGSLVGSHLTIGKMMLGLRIVLTLGTGFNAGSGIWRFTLPAALKGNTLLSAMVEDSSTGGRWSGQCRIIAASASGDNMRIVVTANSGGVTHSSPLAWDVGDRLILHGCGELA